MHDFHNPTTQEPGKEHSNVQMPIPTQQIMMIISSCMLFLTLDWSAENQHSHLFAKFYVAAAQIDMVEL